MRTIAILGALALPLAACMSTGPFTPRAETGIWLRSDGQSGKDNPAFAARFASDKAACTPPGGEIDRNCMARAGYLLVPASQVEARAAELRARAGTTAAN